MPTGPNDTLKFEASEAADVLRSWGAYVRSAPTAGWGQVPAVGMSYAEYGASVVVHTGRTSDGEIRCGALVLCIQPLPIPLRIGICLGGPVTTDELFPGMVDHLKQWAASRRLSHLVLSPAVTSIPDWQRGGPLRSGAHFAPIRYPARSLVVNVRRSDDELLASFRADTRRNIRVAAKAGQTFERATTGQRAREVAAWVHDLHVRNKIPIRAQTAFLSLAEQLVERQEGEVLAVLHEEKLVSAGVFPIAGNTLWYLSGAFDRDARDTYPAHLLQFRAMTLARDLGLDRYDFTSRSVDSVYQFKRGFRPVEYDTAGEFEIPVVKPVYHLLQVVGPWAQRHRRTLGALIAGVRRLTR